MLKPQYFFLWIFLVLPFWGLTQPKDYNFQENKGQWPSDVKYRAESQGGHLYFENNAFHYQFAEIPDSHNHGANGDDKTEHAEENIKGHVFRAEFINANKNARIKSGGKSSYYHNYFLGNDKSKWASEIHSYSAIEYENLYDGINLSFYKKDGFYKYDYVVKPGNSPDKIIVKYKGVEVPIIKDGNLIINHSIGKLIEEKPYAYQIKEGKEIEVVCNYVLNETGDLSFDFPNEYDKSLELVIDPALIFSTYSGSASGNFGMTATYDRLGFGYSGGTIFTTGFITSLGAYDTTYNSGTSDIAIQKYSPDGTHLVYGTYLGGGSSETVHSMVVDDSLNLIVFGVTGSANFPSTTNAYDTQKEISPDLDLSILSANFTTGPDIYITKFNSSGTQLKASTFFGGNQEDGLNVVKTNLVSSNVGLLFSYGDQFRGEVITDSLGNIFIGSVTYSSGLSTGINTFSGIQDGIIAKFSPDLSTLLWSRYLGGSNYDAIYSLKILPNGNVLVGGGTNSFNDFPVTSGSYQSNPGGGRVDGFVSIISADGQSVLKSSFVGTSNYDQVYFIDFDRFSGVYALGQSVGGNMPLKNTQIADTSAGQFILKFDPNLDSLEYATTFGDGGSGGQINITPTAFLVDQCQNVYVSGWGGTLSGGVMRLTNNMPITSDAYRSATTDLDFYLYVMSRNADSLLYASFFGGTLSTDHVDGGTSRFDKRGVIYQSVCASCSNSQNASIPADTLSDFPTTPNSFSPKKLINIGGNNCNNALFKFDFEILPRAKIITSRNVICAPGFVNFKDSSSNAAELVWDFFGTRSRTQGLDTNIFFSTPGFYTVTQLARDTICNSFDSTFIVIEVQPNSLQYDRIDDIFVCDPDTVLLNAQTDQTADIFHWSSNANFTDTLQARTDSILKVRAVNLSTPYYLKIKSDTSICELLDTINVQYIPLFANASILDDTICEGNNIQFNSNFVNANSFKWDFGNGTIDTNNLNPTTSYLAAGDYQIQVIISNSTCRDSDTTTLNLNVRANQLQIEAIPDTTYCGTDTLDFKINSFGTSTNFLWSSQGNFSDTLNSFPIDSTIQIFSNRSGNLYKKITDQFCERVSEVTVQYISYEIDLAALPDSVCAPADIQVNSTQTGVSAFNFDFGNGTSENANINPITSYPDSGTFIISLVGSNPICPRSDTLLDTIRVEPEVRVANPDDTLICLGDTVQLTGNSFGTGELFYWSDKPDFSNIINTRNDSSISITSNQFWVNYYFKAVRSICKDSTQQIVETQDASVFVDDFTSICLDDTISLQASNNGISLSYLWEPNDSIISGQGTNTILIAPKNSMHFDLSGISSIGCKGNDTAFVEVNKPAFNDADIITQIDTIFEGQQIQLSTNRNGANLTYLWEPASSLNDARAANPFASPLESTTYRVTITDNNTGCEVVALRRLNVFEINCAEPEIFIPTAFTPNNDGVNDRVFVRGIYLSEIEFEIYNRWGELVFKTTDINKGWDGTYKGKQQNTDVFNYYLKATCFDGQEFFKKGNISLIR